MVLNQLLVHTRSYSLYARPGNSFKERNVRVLAEAMDE